MNRLALLLVLLVSVTDTNVYNYDKIEESPIVEHCKVICNPRPHGITMGYYKYG